MNFKHDLSLLEKWLNKVLIEWLEGDEDSDEEVETEHEAAVLKGDEEITLSFKKLPDSDWVGVFLTQMGEEDPYAGVTFTLDAPQLVKQIHTWLVTQGIRKIARKSPKRSASPKRNKSPRKASPTRRALGSLNSAQVGKLDARNRRRTRPVQTRPRNQGGVSRENAMPFYHETRRL